MFGLWAYLPSNPNERIGRVCEPVRAATSLAGSLISVSVDRQIGDDWKKSATGLHADCALVFWEHFFGDEYRRELGYPPGTPLDAIADDQARGVSPLQLAQKPSSPEEAGNKQAKGNNDSAPTAAREPSAKQKLSGQ